MKISVFNAQKYGTLKTPKSPYKDNTFNFSNIDVETLKEAYRILSNNFTLALQYDLPQTIRTFRRKENLTQFLKFQEYMVLDIDCNSKENLTKILEYFKTYKCILGESKSFNSRDNFNLKGILILEKCDYKEYKNIFKNIQKDISKYGYLDDRITQVSHFIFPFEKFKPIQISNGILYPKKDFKDTNEYQIIPLQSTKYVDMCKEYFKYLGFFKISETEYTKNNLKFYWNQDFPYVLHCERKSESVNIFETIDKIQRAKIIENISKYSADLIVNEKYLWDYNFDLKELKKYKVLGIKSPMGSAKSELIKNLIKGKDRVLIITSRISLALEFNKKFKLPLYLNVNFKKAKEYHKINYQPGNSLICQYDSLMKINPKNFDIVVLDEFVSILLHSIDNLSKVNGELLRKFQILLTKKCIVSDAFLSDYVMDFFEGPKFLIKNESRTNVKLTEAKTKNEFLDLISKTLEENKKITISTSSVSEIYREIKSICSLKDKSLKFIQGQNTETQKKETIEDFNSDEINYDVIVYSPVVTIGVSIFNDADVHFHYDGSNSIPTIQSIQMLGRARKVKNFVYFVSQKFCYCPLDIESEIQWEIQNRHKNSDSSWVFELDDFGELKLSKIGEFWIKIKKYLRFLKRDSRASFEALLKDNFSNLKS